jgi:hypothetical protein
MTAFEATPRGLPAAVDSDTFLQAGRPPDITGQGGWAGRWAPGTGEVSGPDGHRERGPASIVGDPASPGPSDSAPLGAA